MGYTHSWLRPRQLASDRFAAAAQDCRRICEASGVQLRGIEGRTDPIFEEFIVAFDGGCEPFVVQCVSDGRSPERPRPNNSGTHRGFCKTEHLPYDICVQGCLIAFNHFFGDDFSVSSDGTSSDWDAAPLYAGRRFGSQRHPGLVARTHARRVESSPG